MKALAVILLLAVFTTHAGANWLAAHSSYSPKATFYMLSGMLMAILSGVILIFLFSPRLRVACASPTIWRSIALVVLGASICEGAMMPACLVAIPDLRAVPKGTDLCDFAAGLPIGATTFALYCIILTVTIARGIVSGEERS